jgi:phosphonate metabolism protein (transferase hexapeptide repeat family)
MNVALRRRFPTCEFYDGALVDANSSLGKYNVIFDNTTICNSSIGNHTYVQKNSNISNCKIGKFCSIAPNVNIGLGQHPIERVSTHPAFYSSTQPLAISFADADTYDPLKPIIIGNDVWIGHSALVMDGIAIGNGAVVAANAVVTTDVPPYAIVGGVPARIIRFRFDQLTCSRLNASEWWDKPEEWLAENCRKFANPEEFLKMVDDVGSKSRSPNELAGR